MSETHACKQPDREANRSEGGSAQSAGREDLFGSFADSIKQHLQAEVALLGDENEELEPRAYAVGPTRRTVVRIEQSLLIDQPEARVLEEMLPELVRHQHSVFFGCAWTVFTESPKPLPELSDDERRTLAEGRTLRGWPARARWRRREEVLLMLLAHDRREAWRAQLIRPHGQPCTLGYWATLGHEQHWQHPMFRNLRAAIRGPRESARGR